MVKISRDEKQVKSVINTMGSIHLIHDCESKTGWMLSGIIIADMFRFSRNKFSLRRRLFLISWDIQHCGQTMNWGAHFFFGVTVQLTRNFLVPYVPRKPIRAKGWFLVYGILMVILCDCAMELFDLKLCYDCKICTAFSIILSNILYACSVLGLLIELEFCLLHEMFTCVVVFCHPSFEC